MNVDVDTLAPSPLKQGHATGAFDAPTLNSFLLQSPVVPGPAATKRRTQGRREALSMEHYIVLHALAVRLKLYFVDISLNQKKQRQ